MSSLAMAAPPAGAAEPAPLPIDDPQEWPNFGRALGEGAQARWESQVVVDGMHCAACTGALEAALLAVPGVHEARVDAATRRARVLWSPAAVRPSRWFAAAAAAGYRLAPAGDAAERRQRADQARAALWRWLVAGLCMMQVMMYAAPAYVADPQDLRPDMAQLLRWASWVLSLPVLLFACRPFFGAAWRDLRARRIGMDLPVALGMALAFAVSSAGTFDPAGRFGREVYFDSFTMFVFFLLTGRWLETLLRARTAGALEALAARLPEGVQRRRADGRFETVAPRRINLGDVLRVRAGEAFAADGTLIEGATRVDEALLSGESRPLARATGSTVLAGSHNLEATVLLRVDALGGDTRFGQIVALMDRAALDKPRIAQLADRVAQPFLFAVLLAAALAAVPGWRAGDPGHALMTAVAVLIVTCPCALSLATPTALLASAGALARRGVFVARIGALEELARVDTLIFDKTGTLTEGAGIRPSIEALRMPADAALALAAALAEGSLHPVARALQAAGEGLNKSWQIDQVTEHPGRGLSGRVRARNADGSLGASTALRLGSPAFCGVAPLGDGLQAVLADEQGALARWRFDEVPRPDASSAIAALRHAQVALRILSGDRQGAVDRIAQPLRLVHARGDCQPEHKQQAVQALQQAGHRVAMVGDGLNDGPAIAQADVSLSFGDAVPLARARADIAVPGGALTAIPLAVLQARRTMRVMRQNIAWALAYNLACVPLAVLGWLPAWLAGLGMAASSLAVFANSARLARLPAVPHEAA